LRLCGGYPLSLRSHHCAASYPIQLLHLPARTRSPKGPHRTIHHSRFLQAAEYSKKKSSRSFASLRLCGGYPLSLRSHQCAASYPIQHLHLPAHTRSPKGPHRTIHHSCFLQAAEYSKKNLRGPSRRCAFAVVTRSLYEAITVLLATQFSISTCPRAPVALKGPTAQSITAAFFKQQSIPKKSSRSIASLRLCGGYPLSLRSHHCAASYPIQHLHLPARTRSPKGPNRTIHHSRFLQAAEYSKKIFAVHRVVAPLRWLPALSTKPSLCC